MSLFLTDPKTLPFEDRMKTKGGWLERESIANIALACHPDNTKERTRLITALIGHCKQDNLAYYGDINGWEWGGNEFEYKPSRYPEITGRQIDQGDPMLTALSNKWRAGAADCLIHKDEFKRFLQKVEKWPATGFLANWWSESKDNGGCLDEDVYEQRRKSFECWLSSQGVDIANKDEAVRKLAIKTFLDGFGTVPDIYDALKEARKGDINTNKKGKGKGMSLWIYENPEKSLETFKRSFWQDYCQEIAYSRK